MKNLVFSHYLQSITLRLKNTKILVTICTNKEQIILLFDFPTSFGIKTSDIL